MADKRGKFQGTRSGNGPPPQEKIQTEPLNAEHEKMLRWLQTVRFRREIFGGVSEEDLWKKLSELNELYNASLIAERARFDALLEAQTRAADEKFAESQRALQELRAKYEAAMPASAGRDAYSEF